MKVVPLTSYTGNERDPSLSPDGNQAAFVWNGPNQDNYDIYIKLIDGGAPLRLTTDPAVESAPAFSPDGRRIAFRRGRGVYVMSALGGAERKIGESNGNRLRLSWSPDGQYLALSDRDEPNGATGIFLLSVESGEKRRLTTPPADILPPWGDHVPSFSSEGRNLAFIRARITPGMAAGIYRLPLTAERAPAGEPRRVTSEDVGATSLDWTPDGRSIVFASPAGLMRISADSPGEPRPIPVQGMEISQPSVARRAGRLAYTASVFDMNLWRIASRGDAAPVKLIASTWLDITAEYSPDGTRIAFVSTRSGSPEIWVSDREGANPTQLTFFGGGSPRWSPDGRWIAFGVFLEGHFVPHVMPADGGKPRRLLTDRSRSNQTRPAWSPDGRWIYFASDRTGEMQIWRMPATGGTAQPLTRKGGRDPWPSADGAFVYFVQNFNPGIWRVPAGGGEETQVLPSGRIGWWAVSATGIYLLDPRVKAVEFYRFGADRPTRIVRLPAQTRFATGSFFRQLAISPDEQWILYNQVDREESDLMLVENFR
jgi:Tol biopolymer transport system component